MCRHWVPQFSMKHNLQSENPPPHKECRERREAEGTVLLLQQVYAVFHTLPAMTLSNPQPVGIFLCQTQPLLPQAQTLPDTAEHPGQGRQLEPPHSCRAQMFIFPCQEKGQPWLTKRWDGQLNCLASGWAARIYSHYLTTAAAIPFLVLLEL